MAGIVLAGPPSSANFALFQVAQTAPTPTAAVVKNIVSDFGATCNGTGDDNSAFDAFNAWAIDWQDAENVGLIELDIPNGAICMFSSGGLGNRFSNGIKQLLVVGLGYVGQGDGATFSDNNGAGNGWFLGSFRGVLPDNQHSARLETVSAGSSCVNLLTPAQSSLFSIGQYVLISGIDMMGFGFPPNPFFYEYPKITSVDGSAGTVCFDAPLRNAYKSTWPVYFAGSAFEADQGGPATLYALDPDWDTEAEYRGITFKMDGFQTYAIGRSITYRNAAFTGTNCAVPTQNMHWTAINSDFSNCAIEVDKIVDVATLNQVTIRRIIFQSASVNVFNLVNSTVTDAINGTPKKFVGSDSTIASLGVGAYAFGRSDETICTNCNISAIVPQGVNDKGGVSNVGVDNFYTMSGGIIASANSNGPPQWYIPGTHLYWSGRFDFSPPHCEIIDVTQGGGNTYVQTSCTGGFPNIPMASGPLGIRVHPSPKFTCTNCSGSIDAIMLSQAPAGAPLGSYFKRTYDPSTATRTAFLFGTMVSVNFDVTTPYTGGSSLNFNLDGPFMIDPGGTTFSAWDPKVNPSITGTRSVDPTSVTGAQSGDSLSSPGMSWFVPAQVRPRFSADISAEAPSTWPTITVEIITDQGVNP